MGCRRELDVLTERVDGKLRRGMVRLVSSVEGAELFAVGGCSPGRSMLSDCRWRS